MKMNLKAIFTVILMISSLAVMAQPPSGWNYTITSDNHVIIFPSTALVTISGNPAPSNNCWIGVFYNNSTGGLNCGGYAQWTGVPTNVTAWAVDAGNDGFQPGEEFKWKIYAGGTEYSAIADYSGTGPNTNTFVINGMSIINSLSAYADLKLTMLLSPQSDCTIYGIEPITIEYTNNGTYTFISGDLIAFKVSIDGVQTITELFTLTTDMYPNDTAEYTFFASPSNYPSVINPGNYLFNVVGIYGSQLLIPDIYPYNDTLNVIVSNWGIPVISLGPDTIYTHNPDTVKLNPGPGFLSYHWNAGQTSQFIFANSSLEEYCVTVTSNHGCEGEGCIIIIDTTSTFVENLVLNEINLFPNPSKDLIFVKGIRTTDIIRLYDFSGKELYIRNIAENPGEINLNGLSEGVYLLHIKRSDQVQVVKILKE